MDITLPEPVAFKNGKIKFDWTINITTLIGIVVLTFTIVKYGNDALTILRDIRAKTNVMWAEYAKSHPDAEAVIRAYHDKE